ncbi:MAG: hypothetical protein AAGA56_19065, partial [Myxococcota bacterium]
RDSGDLPVTIGNYANNFGPSVVDISDTSPGAEVLIEDLVVGADGCVLNGDRCSADGVCAVSGYLNVGAFSHAADLDGDGAIELADGRALAEWDDETRSWVTDPSVTSESRTALGHVAVGNFSSNVGHTHVAVVSHAPGEPDGRVRLQSLAGEILWGPFALHRFGAPAADGNRGGAPTAADFDGDGMLEIGVAGRRSYAVYDPDCAPGPDGPTRSGGACNRGDIAASNQNPNAFPHALWFRETEDLSNVTGSTVFDFEFDGAPEVVYRDECSLHVFNGRTGADQLAPIPATSRTSYDYPTVADVGGPNPAAEIIVPRSAGYVPSCSTDPSPGGMVILKHATDGWAHTRPIWNQHAFSGEHVSDTGAILSAFDGSWLGQERAASSPQGFRANHSYAPPAENAAPQLVLSDVAAVPGRCPNPKLHIRARVCNEGAAVAEDVRIRAFRTARANCPGGERDCDGPWTQVDSATTTLRTIQPGVCRAVSWPISPSDDWVRVVADDQNTLLECREDDNAGVARGSDIDCSEENDDGTQ